MIIFVVLIAVGMGWDGMGCHAMPCHAMPCHAMPCGIGGSRRRMIPEYQTLIWRSLLVELQHGILARCEASEGQTCEIFLRRHLRYDQGKLPINPCTLLVSFVSHLRRRTHNNSRRGSILSEKRITEELKIIMIIEIVVIEPRFATIEDRFIFLCKNIFISVQEEQMILLGIDGTTHPNK
jgi:hypothetical protein